MFFESRPLFFLFDFRYTPRGDVLVTCDASDACFWDTKSWQMTGRHRFAPHEERPRLGLSLERNQAITWVKGEAVLEDLATGKTLGQFPGHERLPNAAMFSFDGKIACLTSVVGKGKLHTRFFSLPDCKELFERTFENVTSPAFSPVGASFLWLESDGTYAEIDAATGTLLRKFNPRPDRKGSAAPAQLTFSWDGRYIAFRFGEADVKEIPIWDVTANRVAFRVPMHKKDYILDMDVTYDNRLLVCNRAGQPGIRIIELASGKERRPLLPTAEEAVRRLATSPVDYTVAAGAGPTVLIWDLAKPAKKPAAAPLGDEDLAALWRDLADADALKAEEAIETWVQLPRQAIRYIRDRLKPAKVPAPADAATVQALRGLEVLEKIGGPDVLPVLEALAADAPSAQLAQEAAAAVKRLQRKR